MPDTAAKLTSASAAAPPQNAKSTVRTKKGSMDSATGTAFALPRSGALGASWTRCRSNPDAYGTVRSRLVSTIIELVGSVAWKQRTPLRSSQTPRRISNRPRRVSFEVKTPGTGRGFPHWKNIRSMPFPPKPPCFGRTTSGVAF